jgi:hypothetical protein
VEFLIAVMCVFEDETIDDEEIVHPLVGGEAILGVMEFAVMGDNPLEAPLDDALYYLVGYFKQGDRADVNFPHVCEEGSLSLYFFCRPYLKVFDIAWDCPSRETFVDHREEPLLFSVIP